MSYRFTTEKRTTERSALNLTEEALSSPFLEPFLWPHFGACSSSTSMTQQAG